MYYFCRMEYQMNNNLRAHLGKVTTYRNFFSFATVIEGLDEEHIEILHRSFLWSFYPLKGVQFSGQIIDSLLLQLLKPVDDDQLYFAMGDGKVSRFSILEFALITGLRCTGEEEVRTRIIPNKRLLNLCFGGKGPVTPPQLEDAFRRCDHMLDKLKLGLVYILESILRCRHRRTSIDLFSLDVVDDIDAFNSFSWGRRCYTDTLHVFRRVHTMPKSEMGERKYDLWAYEVIPTLGSKWAIRREINCPRMLHWRAHEKPSAKI
ncbi:uncharacterized protein LOC111388796 isoform X2 [Olea europaea var. sylvestris]|uniref:uncharacterized protein LOC111388796 isoform X2 n=1 Tax=Olea europaea var. sylvestris TaxID=158386 RepID=UPI000C1D66E5|nr:uncharacterized protein LOC111388796 isoform X2 [Olea europaea var. sylvestris]